MQYVQQCTLSECMLSLGRQLQRYCMITANEQAESRSAIDFIQRYRQLLCALLSVYAVDLVLGSLGCGRALDVSSQYMIVVSISQHMQNVND